MDNDVDYEAQADEIIRLIETDPTEAKRHLSTPDVIVRLFPPYHTEAGRVREVVRRFKSTLGYGLKEFDDAARHWRSEVRQMQKAADKLAQKQLRDADVMAHLGGMPHNEREYVEMVMENHQYDMTYDRRFWKDGEATGIEKITADLQLTAADLKLVKPRGDLLGTTNIDRALFEWTENRRVECKTKIIDRIMVTLDAATLAKVNADFAKWCQFYYIEGEYAEACIRKFIWQVKRKLLGLPVNQIHFFVTVGAQNTGKTYTARKMIGPVNTLSAECSLQDALDDRQMDLPTMYILFMDELARLDRVDSTALKTFITGEGSARRPMRTNVAQKVVYNASLFATSNNSLDLLIFDNTGMRRYVEIAVKLRSQIEPHWDFIENFNWLKLWQAVDPSGDDPLVSKYDSRLRDKQETIRNRQNVELWLNQFEYHANQKHYTKQYGDQRYGVDEGCYHRPETSSHEKLEFYAQELYLLFRSWEDVYDPKYPTSLNAWGKQMKSLIDTATVPDWEWHMAGTKKVYGWKLKQNQPGNGLVPVTELDKWRSKNK